VFLTRSIRRKLVLSLALVTAMLGLLAFGAISGLWSYRSVINDLEYTITSAPRRGDVVAAISPLFQPLMLEIDAPDDDGFRQTLWNDRITAARDEIQKFRMKLERVPPSQVSWDQRPLVDEMLLKIQLELIHLEDVVLREKRGGDRLMPDRDPWRIVTRLAQLAENVPSPEERLRNTLNDARDVYRSRFYLVCGALGVTLLLFAGLVRCAYVWIFVPIRKLHQGAARVAFGDFDHRVKLAGRDEMAELAETFNQVVDRFQQIKSKLDKEVRERSRQLVRSERLAGVGFLAAGVAHEINNPLSAIAMAAESLEGRVREAGLAKGPPAPQDVALVTQYLSMIQKEAFRCQQITARLLDFARGQDAPKTRQDLTKIVSDVLELVSHLSKFRGHTIVFDRQRSCCVEANGPEIKQVVLNMVANALEAMEGKGTLRIDLEEQADEVILSFQDTGCGMTPYVLENLFEPFFTERKSGKGTGLGLSISHRIVSEHGGRIEAFSEGPGRGSCFRIHLPRKAAAPLARAA
jgi:signal transduction histidine kinase